MRKRTKQSPLQDRQSHDAYTQRRTTKDIKPWDSPNNRRISFSMQIQYETLKGTNSSTEKLSAETPCCTLSSERIEVRKEQTA
uniref:T4.2 protein n=1 Tax=Malus x robusta TaxID=1184610 RepID=I7KCV6_9ROSA|nr:T4.2 [Malus x robusta]